MTAAALSHQVAKAIITEVVIPGLTFDFHLRVYNREGQLVYEEAGEKAERVKLDLSNLAPGLYLVEVESGDEKRYGRVVLMR